MTYKHYEFKAKLKKMTLTLTVSELLWKYFVDPGIKGDWACFAHYFKIINYFIEKKYNYL